MEGRHLQLDLSAAVDTVSRRTLLYKLKSIDVGGQFLSIVSEFLSTGRQRMHLNGKVIALVNLVS